MAFMNVRMKKDLSGVNKKLGPAAMKRAENGLGEQVTKDMFPYVPKGKTKRLSKGVWNPAIKASVYDTPYARKQFNAPGGWKYTTPGTGPRWDKKAKAKHGKSWSNRVAKQLGG